ncbi:MAG: NAD(P)-dependent oxidoreductase [Terriglobales bacterium]
MKRVAILGANGQVGTEVSLRLRGVEGIEVVPIARNVSGSAFLRSNGMQCRHGRITDAAEAPLLIGDCDVVVNFALSNTAVPRTDRESNRQIVRSMVAAAKPGAPIIFASTIMVYAPGMKFWFPDSYGLEKLVAERLFRRVCRASRHPAFVFRLGHVMGEMQNITSKIRGEIRNGKVALPHQGFRASNTVFTASIVEAIVQIARAHIDQKPGTYDLISFPQWTWLEVYQYYAAQIGLPLQLANIEQVRDARRGWGGPGVSMRRFLRYLANHRTVMERLTFLLAFLPRNVNRRIYLRYLQTRALTEINALRASRNVEFCVQDWRELRGRSFGQLADPITLMARYPLPSAVEVASPNRPIDGMKRP